MKYQKSYYKNLNVVRLVACIAILFYHLGILRGGYLGVCVFFVLSGYLSCLSAFKKEKFSFKEYYINKLKNIYLPLVMVVLITVGLSTYLTNFNWLNLKPETTSVLLGYNNYWQIGANLDYFARHIDSPFMHFWYMGILLQFDLIFPLGFVILRKVGEKIKSWLSCGLLGGLTIGSFVYFVITNRAGNIMLSYYGTFTRAFALLFGMFLGFRHYYYKPLVVKKWKNKIYNRRIFYSYLVLLALMCSLLNSNGWLMILGMFFTTIITGRLISYAVVNSERKVSKYDKAVKRAASISYEIYLWQYPLIFVTQYLEFEIIYQVLIVILGVIILAIWLHWCLKKEHNTGIVKAIKIILLMPLVLLTLYGGAKYCLAKDHTEEMAELERQLQINEQMIKDKQAEYAERFRQEEEDWLAKLSDLEDGEKEIANIVSNLSVVGIGDSVMLGAVDHLYEQFPNGYFDAAISRTAWVADDILNDLKTQELLGDVVVINLGANGDCSKNCKSNLMDIIGDRMVYWVNIKNNETLHFNETLVEFAKDYDNLKIIDWYNISDNHPEYFIADGIHLTEEGRVAYTKAIYDSIYNTYLEEYRSSMQGIIDEHEEKEKKKVTMFGNDMLINAYDYLQDDFKDTPLIGVSDLDYNNLFKKVETAIQNDTLTYNVVFILDESFVMNKEEFDNLINLCQDKMVYIISLNDNVNKVTSESHYENVSQIDFMDEVASNEDYLLADKIHLSDTGNRRLREIIRDTLKIKWG